MRPLSEAGTRLLAELSASGERPRRLWEEFASHGVPDGDLPELIWFAWVNTDEPTSGLDEKQWLMMFKAAGFISHPNTRERPTAPLTIYRGATADRARRMSWTDDYEMAKTLGTQHTWHGPAAVYKVTAPYDAILPFLGRQDEGWTIVVDTAKLPPLEEVLSLPQRYRRE